MSEQTESQKGPSLADLVNAVCGEISEAGVKKRVHGRLEQAQGLTE